MTKIAILGLGEAGSTIGRDLLANGVEVIGWDPSPKNNLPAGLILARNNPDAVAQADIVFSLNWASVAQNVALEVAESLSSGQIFVDFNTASPQNKRAVADVIDGSGGRFVDGALMAPVPPYGLKTPVYASGRGASAFEAMMTPFGMPITILPGEAGTAATHKLVRSIMYKGVAAVVMECLEAARSLGLEAYAREQMVTLLNDEGMIDRFEQGSIKHATRRMHEMEAVVELLEGIDVAPLTSQAAVERLKTLSHLPQ